MLRRVCLLYLIFVYAFCYKINTNLFLFILCWIHCKQVHVPYDTFHSQHYVLISKFIVLYIAQQEGHVMRHIIIKLNDALHCMYSSL